MSLSVTFVLTLLAIYAIAAVALNLLQGYAGQLSLALAANFAIGAYAFAIVSVKLEWPTMPAVLMAAAVSCALQAALSVLTARLAELYFVLATLALQLIVLAVINSWTDVTGGPAGVFGLPVPAIAGVDLGGPSAFLGFCLLFLALCLVASQRVARSMMGLQLRGLRDDATALISTGYDVRITRVAANAYYSAWFGIAGALYAALLNTVTPLSFSMLLSVTFQSLIIIGGSGSFLGPLVGVVVLIGIPESLRYVSGLGVSDVALAAGRDIAYGVLLILVMRFRPEGIFPMRPRHAGPRWTTSLGWLPLRDPEPLHRPPDPARARSGASPKSEVVADRENAAPPAPLEVRHVSLRFGGVQALEGASVTVLAGRVTGIIGPNGAGKSTLFNVATGYLKPHDGAVLLAGRDVTGMSAHHLVGLGIGRTFQNLRLFHSLTVTQNLAMACGADGLGKDAARERVARWLDYFHLAGHAGIVTGELDYGTQKTVALARTLCTGADLLLLDEPASGLDRNQVAALADSLGALVRADGLTVCLVEHNMDLIRDVADDVYAMHEGRTIATGDAHSVLSDPDVRRVYLGA